MNSYDHLKVSRASIKFLKDRILEVDVDLHADDLTDEQYDRIASRLKDLKNRVLFEQKQLEKIRKM